ncbi:hypothetical protein [Krasilnikovia sp. M28-CT-15]|uniref:hypothetical protein n=1 Tax=Krasilnikovia sp. M28-CT-15 TaxID=3373540 RepID=UPI00399D0C5D
MMEVRLGTEAAPGRAANEDGALVVGDLVAVFDGVTQPADLRNGCAHTPAWYVQCLAGKLGAACGEEPDAALPYLLARAIDAVAGEHRGTCDLGHPGTPAATACLLRAGDDQVEYLVLCDSPLVLDLGDRTEVVNDLRFDQVIADVRQAALVPGAVGTAQHAERMKTAATRKWEYTNQPHGYWIAAADPRAAYEAVTGTAPLHGPGRVRRAALLTDGASAAVEQFALYDWTGLLDVLTTAGPAELIRQIRTAEHADRDGRAQPRYKRHDDATAVLCLFDEGKPA